MTIDMFRMIQTLERESKRQEEHNHHVSPPSRQSFVRMKIYHRTYTESRIPITFRLNPSSDYDRIAPECEKKTTFWLILDTEELKSEFIFIK